MTGAIFRLHLNSNPISTNTNLNLNPNPNNFNRYHTPRRKSSLELIQLSITVDGKYHLRCQIVTPLLCCTWMTVELLPVVNSSVNSREYWVCYICDVSLTKYTLHNLFQANNCLCLCFRSRVSFCWKLGLGEIAVFCNNSASRDITR